MVLRPDEIRRLDPFEECAGILRELRVTNGFTTALISKIYLHLPTSLEPSLRPLIGQLISILHTDIPDKPYLFRVLAQEKEVNPCELESGLSIEENEKCRCFTRHRCSKGDIVE